MSNFRGKCYATLESPLCCRTRILCDIAVVGGSQLRPWWRRSGTELGHGCTRQPTCEGNTSTGTSQAVVYTSSSVFNGEGSRCFRQ